jgi:pimeloyl-ACP methyl ester carboxylesterase
MIQTDRNAYVYLPGLGERFYDSGRSLALMLGSSLRKRIQKIDVRWGDNEELFAQKYARVLKTLRSYNCPVHVVAESASGSLAMILLHEHPEVIAHVTTFCGKNLGADNVNELVYQANPAFRESMRRADNAVIQLTDADRQKIHIVYSRYDWLIYQRDTLITGARITRMYTPTHWLSIVWCMLCWRVLTKDKSSKKEGL